MAVTKVGSGMVDALQGRNYVINGCMRVWQRGASPSAATVSFAGTSGFNVAASSASLNDLLGCHWAADAEL